MLAVVPSIHSLQPDESAHHLLIPLEHHLALLLPESVLSAEHNRAALLSDKILDPKLLKPLRFILQSPLQLFLKFRLFINFLLPQTNHLRPLLFFHQSQRLLPLLL